MDFAGKELLDQKFIIPDPNREKDLRIGISRIVELYSTRPLRRLRMPESTKHRRLVYSDFGLRE
jgi:hypothetical protein